MIYLFEFVNGLEQHFSCSNFILRRDSAVIYCCLLGCSVDGNCVTFRFRLRDCSVWFINWITSIICRLFVVKKGLDNWDSTRNQCAFATSRKFASIRTRRDRVRVKIERRNLVIHIIREMSGVVRLPTKLNSKRKCLFTTRFGNTHEGPLCRMKCISVAGELSDVAFGTWCGLRVRAPSIESARVRHIHSAEWHTAEYCISMS